MSYNRNCIYQINYDSSLVKHEFSKLGKITFNSKVLNMMILCTSHNFNDLKKIKGVIKVLPLQSPIHKK